MTYTSTEQLQASVTYPLTLVHRAMAGEYAKLVYNEADLFTKSLAITQKTVAAMKYREPVETFEKHFERYVSASCDESQEPDGGIEQPPITIAELLDCEGAERREMLRYIECAKETYESDKRRWRIYKTLARFSEDSLPGWSDLRYIFKVCNVRVIPVDIIP